MTIKALNEYDLAAVCDHVLQMGGDDPVAVARNIDAFAPSMSDYAMRQIRDRVAFALRAR